YKENYLTLYLPVRKAVAAWTWRMQDIGHFSVPYLALHSNPQKNTLGFYSEITYAWLFASSTFHQYYYGVDPPFETPTRPRYQAKGGFSGHHFTWYLSRHLGKFL